LCIPDPHRGRGAQRNRPVLYISYKGPEKRFSKRSPPLSIPFPFSPCGEKGKEIEGVVISCYAAPSIPLRGAREALFWKPLDATTSP